MNADYWNTQVAIVTALLQDPNDLAYFQNKKLNGQIVVAHKIPKRYQAENLPTIQTFTGYRSLIQPNEQIAYNLIHSEANTRY